MSDVEVRVRGMLEESGLGGSEELVSLLAALEARYVEDVVPEPGPELATLLGGGGAGGRGGAGGAGGRRAAAAGVVALGLVVTTGWAAAANELPTAAQRWVAQFSQRYLPFDVPFPDTRTPGEAPDPAADGKADPRRLDAHDARPTPPDRSSGTSGDAVSTHARRTSGGEETEPETETEKGPESETDDRYTGGTDATSEDESEGNLSGDDEPTTRDSEQDDGTDTQPPRIEDSDDAGSEELDRTDGGESVQEDDGSPSEEAEGTSGD